MAAFNKFYDFIDQFGQGKHQLHAAGHTFKIALTNTAPTSGMTTLGDITEIAATNGYPAGGTDMVNDTSEANGVLTVAADDVTFTASGGTFGPVAYSVTYNSTQTTPSCPLVNWWEYGSSIPSIGDGESFKVSIGTWFTMG